MLGMAPGRGGVEELERTLLDSRLCFRVLVTRAFKRLIVAREVNSACLNVSWIYGFSGVHARRTVR
jgi:hypothetical protein